MNQESALSHAKQMIESGVHNFLTIVLVLSWSQFAAGRQTVTYDPRGEQLHPTSVAPPQSEQAAGTLEPGKPIEREFSGDEAHSYKLTLSAGQYLHVVVDQRGIDVVVTFFGPDGQKLTEVDSPNGTQGPEPLILITKAAGSYRLEVRSLDKNAIAGRYEARIEVLRVVTKQDPSRIAAHRLLLEGEAVRIESTRDSLRLAIQKYGEALSLFRNLGDRKQEAATLNHLAGVYRDLNEWRQALDYHTKALSLMQALGDPDGLASTLNNIGVVHNLSGDYQEALDFFTQALPVFQAIGDHVKEARTLRIIGDVYDNAGEQQKALDHFDRALKLFQSFGDKPREAWTLHSIGISYRKLREDQEAISHFNRALLLYQALGDKSRRYDALIDIGLSYVGLQENQKALDYFNQALLTSDASDREGQAYAFHAIGTAYRNLGAWQNALEYSNRARVIWRAVGNRGGEFMTVYQIARSERGKGNLLTARSHIEAVLEHIESQRAKITGQELRASYFSRQHEMYEFYISLLMQLHNQEPLAGHNAAALQANERARARSLLELLNESGADIRRGVDPLLLERERELQRALNAKAETQTRLLGSVHTKEQASAISKEIDNFASDYQQVRAQIRLTSPRYAALTQPQPLNLREIQQQVLDANTMLLEYALGDERSYLWAVTPTSCTSFELPGRAVIDVAARHVYELLTARGRRIVGETTEARRARIAQSDERYAEAAAAMSRMVLGPVASQLQKRRLLIVSDGALQYVPFAALPAPATLANIAIGTESPLMVEHEIVSIPSASTLAVLRREVRGRRSAPRAVAVLADPVFDKDDERVQSISSKGSGRMTNPTPQTPFSRDVVTRAMEDVSEAESLLRLPRLYNTRWEADVINSLVSKKESMRALDFAANRATATSPELGQYRIVHFATHAFANNVHPELSGIVLSLVDEMGQPQDGFLRTNEIFNLKLPAELVVLSACRTGLGKEVKGEGLIGLTRGFMYAGTPRVVVSLWSLSDRPTAELISRFYKKMLRRGRLPPAAALRAAQLEMWNEKRWDHPYFWAGFVLQGEWR